MLLRLLPAALLAFVVACQSGGASGQSGYKRSEALEKKYAAAVARGEATLGMRRDEVQKAIGKPLRKDTVMNRGNRLERWHYTFSEVHFDSDGYCVRIIHP